jgi:hypothetical protein
MVAINEAEFKRVISALHNRSHPNLQHVERHEGLQISKDRRAAEKLLESFFSKAGLDLGKLNHLHSQEQAELRSIFEKQKADAGKNANAVKAAFRQGIESRLAAIGLVAKPFVPTIVVLDAPFLIWSSPYEPDRLVDWQINSTDSFMKVLVSKPANPGSSEGVYFYFQYLWFNESNSPAVVNVSTSLVFNGFCTVSADKGIISGDTTTLTLTARLGLIRYHGFGIDKGTGESLDGTYEPDVRPSQSQTVASLSKQGDSIFGSAQSKTQFFTFTPFELSHTMFHVPARATAVFEVLLDVYYEFDGDPLDVSNSVTVDFANNGNLVESPFVQLEILNS